MIGVIRKAVGQTPLEVVPDELVRVKLGSVARESVGMETGMFCQDFPDRRSLVDGPSIPKQNDRTLDMPQEMPEESGRFKRADVAVFVKTSVECDSSSFGRDAERRNSRYLGPSSGRLEDWGFAPGCPGAPDAGDQEKARLIEKDEVGVKAFGLFLYEATPSASSAGFSPRLSPAPSFPVFGNSIQDGSETAKDGCDGNGSQTPLESPGQPFFASTGPWQSPGPAGFLAECASTSAFAVDLTWEVGQEPAEAANRSGRACEHAPAIGRRRYGRSQPCGRLPARLFPALATRWPGIGASLTALDFRMVLPCI